MMVEMSGVIIFVGVLKMMEGVDGICCCDWIYVVVLSIVGVGGVLLLFLLVS
jgi:hypothetical protein